MTSILLTGPAVGPLSLDEARYSCAWSTATSVRGQRGHWQT
jgi:hypothetical protein